MKSPPTVLWLFCVCVSACSVPSPPVLTGGQWAVEQLEEYLNASVTELTKEVSGFEHESSISFLSSAYFEYKSSSAFFSMLENQSTYKNSEVNQPIIKTSCKANSFPKSFEYWGFEDFMVEDSHVCYSGVYYPFAHYFVVSTDSWETRHFISAIRN